MSRRLFVNALALVLLALNSATAKAADTEFKIRPLTADAKVEAFQVTDAFRIMLAAYKEDLKEIQADSTYSAEQKSAKAQRIKARVAELLLLHDRIVNISPVVFALTIVGGTEIPFTFLRQLVRIGLPAVELAGGITFAFSKNRGTGHVASLCVGISTLIGPNLQLGTSQVATKRAGATGIKTFVGVAAIVPMNDSTPMMTLGDLQGWYFGGALELSLDSGNQLEVPRTIQVGAFAKPNQVVKFPQAGMVFAYKGIGTADRPITFSAEAMHFGLLASTDGAMWRNPIPFSEGNRTSPHSEANRREAMKKLLPTAEDIAERMKRVQQDLDAQK